MLDESVCHFRGVRSILSLLFYFDGNANAEDADQMPPDVASDLGLHCLPVTLYGLQGKNGLKHDFVKIDLA